jgi:HSP20 family protein
MLPRKRSDFDLWDQMFSDPFFTGEKESKLMRTDIKEKKDKYIVDIDLPGYEKENVKIEVDNGYLIVNAKTSHHKAEKEEGKYVRKERFVGECSRSFYVGEDVKQDDIKASFRNGTLKIEIPKKDESKELPEKKYIPIDD